jgi:hypothetical protein
MTRRTPAHRAPKPRFSLLSLGAGAAVLLAGIVFSASAAGGTYAYLSSSQPVVLVSGGATTATINAGTATLAVNADAISLANLYPGDARTSTITVTNTGSVSLALGVDSITGATAANGLVATVAPGACPGTGTPVTAGPLGTTIAPAGSASICLAVGMATSAPATAQNTSSSIAVALTGTQP